MYKMLALPLLPEDEDARAKGCIELFGPGFFSLRILGIDQLGMEFWSSL